MRRGSSQRFFVTVAGAGFDAVVAARAASIARPGHRALSPRGGGQPSRAPALGAEPRRGRGPARSRSVTGVVIANGPCFGGGMRVAPGADAADGMLDVVVLGALGRAALLRWLPTLYWGGHLRHPRVTREHARSVAVTSAVPVPLQLDGEPWGASPFEVTVCAGACGCAAESAQRACRRPRTAPGR